MSKLLILFFITASIEGYCQFGSPILKPENGQLVRYSMFKSEFVLPRNIDVWLPASYNPKKKYAVLYMQDGQNLFDSTINGFNKQEWGVDETMTDLLNGGKIMDCIVVGIWNTGDHRYGDYFPEKPFLNMLPEEKTIVLELGSRIKYRKFQNEKPNSDNYLKFIVKELKPFIDSHYSTYKDRQHTFIGGSSMGGLISMYAVCEYPKIFGGAACLSTHWAGLFVRKNNPVPPYFLSYLKTKAPSPKNHKLYFDFGTTTLDTLYEEHQRIADTILIQKGYDFRLLKTQKFEGENHSEKAWAKRLKIPLLFLLEKKGKAMPATSN